MPTHEERLGAVEFNLDQFKTETLKAYRDMAFEMTMVKGLTQDAIGRIATLNDTVEKRFNAVDQRSERQSVHLEGMDAHLMFLHQHATRTDEHLARTDERLTNIEQHAATTDERLTNIEQDVTQVKTTLTEHTKLLSEILARLPKAS